MREVTDVISPCEIEPVFNDYFRYLQRGKHLEGYRILQNKYIVSIDGTGYFSSKKINCPSCLIKETKKGEKRYSHLIVQAALMHPDKRQVIPLAPEEVRNTDGTDKQDCETNAGKRLIKKIRESHSKLDIIICGDGLYSDQPFINRITKERMQ